MTSKKTGISPLIKKIKDPQAFPPRLDVKFVTSAAGISQCPDPDLPEYAFLGRSNVGKSSLINMLTGVKGLARVSGTPGKTTLINHFIVEDSWYLVDLPGYGFAKVSREKRSGWDKMITGYLARRTNLLCSFVLIDIRHEAQEIDTAVIRWFGQHHLPLAVIFTKADKLSGNQVDKNLRDYKKNLLAEWDELPPLFLTSAAIGTGRDEILGFIREANRLFRTAP
jgi:GTP-binding protein